MNYCDFKTYHENLPKDIVRLDYIDPAFLNGRLPMSDKPGRELNTKGLFTRKGEGVVQLLSDVSSRFYDKGYSVSAPKGAWPVYYDFLKYSKENDASLTLTNLGKGLPNESKHIILLSNPLIPDGRYLTKDELMRLDCWLSKDSTRWLFLDVAGDYLFRAMDFTFSSTNVVYFGSRTKLEAQKNKEGWALSSSDLLEGFQSGGDIVISPMAEVLQHSFDKVWQMLRGNSFLEEFDWSIPEAGYMTVVDEHYEYFRKKGVAVVPGSVFGFPNDKVSVLSCLRYVPEIL